jgi:uncharacterized iron-regulated membrane protein
LAKPANKRRLRQIILQVHLWPGLVTGLVFFIVCTTGAIYCFAPELQKLTQPYRSVAPQDKPFLSPVQLKAIAEKQLPGKKVSRISYGPRDRAAYVMFLGKQRAYYYNVFLNPYSGEVLKVKNMKRDFYIVVLYLHMNLLIPYGEDIIHWCTLIFLLMLISGLILWWPRNKAARKQSFKVKWNASPKRLNHDLHNVFGFYATWVLIFIVLTGLVWSFDWFAKGMYIATGGGASKLKEKPPVSDTLQTPTVTAVAVIDQVWQQMQHDWQSKYLTAEFIIPADKKAAMVVRCNPEKGTFYKMDYLYFDQYSGKEIVGAFVRGKYSDAQTAADKIKRMNYDIHVGAVLGWPGRIAAFLAALIGASLPITGFYIWWGKRKKAKKGVKQERRVVKEKIHELA